MTILHNEKIFVLLEKLTHCQTMLKFIKTHGSWVCGLVGSIFFESRGVAEAGPSAAGVHKENSLFTYSLTHDLCYTTRRYILLFIICNAYARLSLYLQCICTPKSSAHLKYYLLLIYSGGLAPAK